MSSLPRAALLAALAFGALAPTLHPAPAAAQGYRYDTERGGRGSGVDLRDGDEEDVRPSRRGFDERRGYDPRDERAREDLRRYDDRRDVDPRSRDGERRGFDQDERGRDVRGRRDDRRRDEDDAPSDGRQPRRGEDDRRGPAAPPQESQGERLFVGTQPNCNAGIVSVNPAHLGCATAAIGQSMSSERAGAGRSTPIYAGTTQGRNAGVVTTDPRFGGGATRPIGYLGPPGPGRTRLYVGTQGRCNAGVVTTNPQHNGCATSEIGSTVR